jgi:RNA polymerase sigma-70 factor (ECF subfamily)
MLGPPAPAVATAKAFAIPPPAGLFSAAAEYTARSCVYVHARPGIATVQAELGPALIELLPRLRRFALKLARARDLADDLVQSACERALATQSERGEAPLDAWMFRILRNLYFDRLRRAQVQGTVVDIETQHDLAGADGNRDTEARLTLARVSRAIDALPVEQREVVLLVCVEGLSYRAAADATGVPVGTVMSRLARARIRLAEAAGLDSGAATS